MFVRSTGYLRAMKTATKGNTGEAAVLNALVELGLNVLVPFGSGQPYDLVVHLADDAFLRVQCKTAWRVGGCLVFKARSTDHGRGPQSYVGLADIFGVYFPPTRSVYLVPLEAVADHQGRLRLEPTRNNQRDRVTYAADYEAGRWSRQALTDLAPASRLLRSSAA
jgi:PD-(D/E)XK endonuclease